jgi:hypothetical protein
MKQIKQSLIVLGLVYLAVMVCIVIAANGG